MWTFNHVLEYRSNMVSWVQYGDMYRIVTWGDRYTASDDTGRIASVTSMASSWWVSCVWRRGWRTGFGHTATGSVFALTSLDVCMHKICGIYSEKHLPVKDVQCRGLLLLLRSQCCRMREEWLPVCKTQGSDVTEGMTSKKNIKLNYIYGIS